MAHPGLKPSAALPLPIEDATSVGGGFAEEPVSVEPVDERRRPHVVDFLASRMLRKPTDRGLDL